MIFCENELTTFDVQLRWSVKNEVFQHWCLIENSPKILQTIKVFLCLTRKETKLKWTDGCNPASAHHAYMYT